MKIFGNRTINLFGDNTSTISKEIFEETFVKGQFEVFEKSVISEKYDSYKNLLEKGEGEIDIEALEREETFFKSLKSIKVIDKGNIDIYFYKGKSEENDNEEEIIHKEHLGDEEDQPEDQNEGDNNPDKDNPDDNGDDDQGGGSNDGGDDNPDNQGGGDGNKKTPEEHAKETSTEDLQSFVDDESSDPKLVEIAKKELENRNNQQE